MGEWDPVLGPNGCFDQEEPLRDLRRDVFAAMRFITELS